MFPVETISAKMLDYYVDRRDTLIIDLREKESYMHSHVKGAVNMPYGEIDGYTAFPKGKILVLYCDRGGASLLLARQLAKLGYCLHQMSMVLHTTAEKCWMSIKKKRQNAWYCWAICSIMAREMIFPENMLPNRSFPCLMT